MNKDNSNQAPFCGKLMVKVVFKSSSALLSRFYTHDQALEAIFQSQRMVLGDNLLKVSGVIFFKVCAQDLYSSF